MSAKLFVLLLAFGAAANATTVFGIKLGAPLQMPECGYSRIDASTVIFRPATHGRCYQIETTTGRTRARADDSLLVSWAQPPGIVTGGAFVQLVAGKVAGLGVNTSGIETQRSDYAALVRKFGRPTRKALVPMGNAMGATFDAIRATWNLPNGTRVSYLAADNRIDRGLISISTTAGRAATREQLAKLNQGSGL